MTSPFTDQATINEMIMCTTRYFYGRKTISTHVWVEDLINNWDKLDDGVQYVIRNDLKWHDTTSKDIDDMMWSKLLAKTTKTVCRVGYHDSFKENTEYEVLKYRIDGKGLLFCIEDDNGVETWVNVDNDEWKFNKY